MLTRRQIMKNKGARAIAKHLAKRGWNLKFAQRRRDYYAHGLCEHDDTGANGTITVYLLAPDGGPVSLGSILFILAHEYRHFLHQKLGLFKSYYTRSELDGPKAYRSHYLLAGLAAERDCDKYAVVWLKEHAPGLTSGLSRRDYPIWKVGREALPWRLRQEQAARIGLATALHGGATVRTIKQWREKIKDPGHFDDLDLKQLLLFINNKIPKSRRRASGAVLTEP